MSNQIVSRYPFGFIGPKVDTHVDGEPNTYINQLCDLHIENSSRTDMQKVRSEILSFAKQTFDKWGGVLHWLTRNLDNPNLTDPYAQRLLLETDQYLTFDEPRQIDITVWHRLLIDGANNPSNVANKIDNNPKHSIDTVDDGLFQWLCKPNGFTDLVWFLKIVFGTSVDGNSESPIMVPSNAI